MSIQRSTHSKHHHRTLPRALGLLAGYLGLQWLTGLVFITFIAFLFLKAKSSVPKIADFIQANSLITYSIATFAYVTTLNALRPLTTTSYREILTWHHYIKPRVKQNAVKGMALGLTVVMIGLLAGHFTWLGFYMHLDEIVVSIGSSLFLSAGFISIVVFEEYLLRKVLEPQFRKFGGIVFIQIFSCILYLFIKRFQFDLHILEFINFALLNMILFKIARSERTHISSAAFGSSFFITLHTFFGLPFIGQDMPGILILRAVEEESRGTSGSLSLESLLSGGLQGPENSLILTVLLVVYLTLPKVYTGINKAGIKTGDHRS